MGTPYIGEIRMVGFNFAPVGWALCDGQTLPISENDTLFTLIGTTYGGDGQETFALPNLQARLPMHQGNGHVLAETAGVESVTLTTQQMPLHTHPMLGSAVTGTLPDPGGNVVARSSTPNVDMYLEDSPTVAMSPQMVSPEGGSQPHDNVQPYLVINFIISLYGIFPSPSASADAAADETLDAEAPEKPATDLPANPPPAYQRGDPLDTGGPPEQEA